MASIDDPTLLTESFEYDSFIIRWTAFGPSDGQPLIFIHGTPWSSRLWAPVARAVSTTQKYRIYMFDNPGYGSSQARKAGTQDKEKNVSLAAQASAFAALVEDCWKLDTGRPPIVVAHDFGGIISLRATLLHGIRYKALCLFDPLAVTPFGSPFFRLVSENADVFKKTKPNIFEAMLRAYIREAEYKRLDPAVEDMLALPWLDSQDTRNNFIDQIAQASSKHVAEVEDRYHEIGKSMPVKIVWGVNDALIPVETATKLGEMIGTQRVVIVQEAAHLIMLDQPERVTAEILVWLTEIDK